MGHGQRMGFSWGFYGIFDVFFIGIMYLFNGISVFVYRILGVFSMYFFVPSPETRELMKTLGIPPRGKTVFGVSHHAW